MDHPVRIALVDQLFLKIVPLLSVLSVFNICPTPVDALPTTLVLTLLFSYAVTTIYEAENGGSSQIVRAMAGLLLTVWISFVCAIFCAFGPNQPSMVVQISIMGLSITMIYKTQRLLVSRIGWRQLVIAVILDVMLLLFLLTRLDL
jgi:hypothetical protein